MRFLSSTRAAVLAGAMAAGTVWGVPQAATQQAGAQQAGPKAKSQGELEALQKVQAAAQSQNYDAELQAIQGVLEKYADTEYKPMLLNMAMDAAQRKGDQAQMEVYGEQVLQSDPNNIQARVIMGSSIASHVRENDLDKDQQLKKAEDYGNKALDLLKASPAPPAGFPPDQWPQYQKELTAQAHGILGMAADTRKNYPDAIKHFQAALEANPTDSVEMARLSKAYVGNKQYDEAISTADKVAAMSDAPAPVKQFAAQQKEMATKLKGAAPAK